MAKWMTTTDRLEDRLRDALYRARLPIFLVLVTAVAFYARFVMWPFVSEDYSVHLYHWLNDIRDMHGFHSIGQQVGNYTAPYHYLMAGMTYIPGLTNLLAIKIPSTIADFLMAGAAGLLVWQMTGQKWKAAVCYCVLLFLPTVFLNSAVWGQCDAMYTTLLLFFLSCLRAGRKTCAALFFGLALAVKLQAVFVFPALVIFWLCSRMRLRQLLAIAVGYVVPFIPAMVAAGSFAPLYEPYRMQAVANTYASNIFNAASLFPFGEAYLQAFSTALIALCMLAIAAVAMVCWQRRAAFTPDVEFLVVLLMACMLPYLLPAMRDRYFFVAEVLAVLYALRWPRRFWVPVVLQLGSLPAYLAYLAHTGNPWGPWLVAMNAVPSLVVLWDLVRHLSVNTARAGTAEPALGADA